MNKTEKTTAYRIFIYIFALSLLIAGNFAEAVMQAPADFKLTEKGKLSIGMNLNEVNYYTTALTFSDAKKTSSALFTYPHGDWNTWDSKKISQVPVDENGWPLKIPYEVDGVQQDVRFLLNRYYSGDYVLLHDGEGVITVSGATSQTVGGIRHITFLGASGKTAWLNITSSTNGNHIRNMRIIPVEYLDNENSMPAFRSDFIAGLQPFHALRFMDFANTNNSTNNEWSDRNTKNSFTQGNGKGVAWEYMIDLANQLNADPWICIPHAASDDYITQLAALLKKTLNADRKLYLEFSNEIWNWQFTQAGYILDNAQGHTNSYVSADLAAIGPAGSDHPEKDAYMMARMFRIFTQVWGDQSNRLVRLATGQHGWSGNSGRILKYLFETDGIGADALSVGGYFSFNNDDHEIWNAMDPATVTPEMVLQSAENLYPSREATWTRNSAAYANQYGVDYIVYEGGQHMQPYSQSDWAYNHAVYDAQIHPGIYDLYMDNFAVHQEPEVNCKLFVAYSYVGLREQRFGSWGHLESLEQLDSPETLMLTAPKYKALLNINATR